MASLESPQIQVLVDSVGDREERRQVRGEQRPLLNTNNRRRGAEFCLKRSCIKSKSALLILCWEMFINLVYGYVVELGSFAGTGFIYQSMEHAIYNGHSQFQTYATSFFALLAILYLFYPLAGCLADIRCGRYKTVLYSLWFMIWSGVFTCIGSIILSLYSFYILQVPHKIGSIILLSIGFGSPAVIGALLILSSSIAFHANVIQFGMDQLHDSPSEDSVLFIHWFVFILHLGAGINKLTLISIIYRCCTPQFVAGLHATPIVALILLCISAWTTRHKRHWFLIDSGSRNPYKLVYKVIKFAAQHKSPIRRSAFTYCEDELPSRMDLAKDKYGGPFTTEQVEDVKAFLGILSILLTFRSVFATQVAVSNILYKFIWHFQDF